MKKTNKLFAILIYILINLSSCSEKRDLYVFIPDGFEGDINIEYEVDSSKNELFEIQDKGYIIFLKGNNLSYYTLKNGPLKDGLYEERFFYYSDSSLCELETGPTIKDDSIKLGGISRSRTGGIKHWKDVIVLYPNQQCRK